MVKTLSSYLGAGMHILIDHSHCIWAILYENYVLFTVKQLSINDVSKDGDEWARRMQRRGNREFANVDN